MNKFLLESYEFMPEMRLRELGFTYSACGTINKKKERIQKIKKKGIKVYSSQQTR